jgi:hypothetical protein
MEINLHCKINKECKSTSVISGTLLSPERQSTKYHNSDKLRFEIRRCVPIEKINMILKMTILSQQSAFLLAGSLLRIL